MLQQNGLSLFLAVFCSQIFNSNHKDTSLKQLTGILCNNKHHLDLPALCRKALLLPYPHSSFPWVFHLGVVYLTSGHQGLIRCHSSGFVARMKLQNNPFQGRVGQIQHVVDSFILVKILYSLREGI